MAGYFIDGCHLQEVDPHITHSFHIGDNVNPATQVCQKTQSHVLTLQVDGDERAAVLWGLENYKKFPSPIEFTIDVTPRGWICTCGESGVNVPTGATARRYADMHSESHAEADKINIFDYRQGGTNVQPS